MAARMKRVSLYRKSVRGKFSSVMESSSTCTWVLLHVVTQLSLSTNLQPGKCIIWCFPWSDHCAYISSADTLDVTQCTLDVSRSPWQERCVFDCVTSMRHAGWRLRDAHFCFPNTDHVTIPRRFEPLSCSLKRLRASKKMSNFERKCSPGFHHVLY